jgi:hypothetical protein
MSKRINMDKIYNELKTSIKGKLINCEPKFKTIRHKLVKKISILRNPNRCMVKWLSQLRMVDRIL